MLTSNILDALKQYTANMKRNVSLVVQQGAHPKREELLGFLNDFASVSDKLTVQEQDASNILRSPVSFTLQADGNETGVVFSGIPSGHEFNSLVLAVLQAGGAEIKLDSGLKQIVANVGQPLKFEVFVSLSCHNCPDVVQALNQFALLNSNISVEMIDGGLFKDVVESREIQGVPSVYLNNEVFANGKTSAADLIAKLVEKFPHIKSSQSKESLPLQDVTVIGGGPAGVSAAIYAARKGLKVTVVADQIGGQVKDTMGIENLISVTHTTGPQLTAALHNHLNEYDVTIKEHLKVESVEQGDIKKINLSSGETIYSKTLIVATGAKWRELGVPGEKENIGNGVAYCPHCDGPFFKGKDVAVIGGGNSGIEAALDLSGIVKSVTVFEFLPELKADKVLVEKAEAKANIAIIKNAATKSIKAEGGKVSAIEFIDRKTETVHEQHLQGVFVQIGLVPNSEFLAGVVERTKFGEVVVNVHCQTSQPGIFACGDVSTVPYKQIVIAMGEGAKASLSAFDYLIREGDRLENIFNNLVFDDKNEQPAKVA